MTEQNGQELYKKYRPTKFSELIGQDRAINALAALGKRDEIPHAILFTGESGCGKTTLARILKTKLKCSDHDFMEINAAEKDTRGIDLAKTIKDRMSLSPMGGPCKIYLIDECHATTPACQDSLLKMLEDTPKHVYFFLCTTDPHKLKKTIITRCTEIRVRPLQATELQQLLERVTNAEGIQLDEEVRDALIEAAEGSARKVLVLLHSVMGIEDKDQQLAAIENRRVASEAIQLCRALLSARSFADLRPILSNLNEDAEGVRRCVLGYMTKAVLSPKTAPKTLSRALLVIDCLRDNLYDSGMAGLVLGCHEIFAK